jgi:hypothetical protein
MQLRSVIELGETGLVEFKREWWNMAVAEGKAKLARAVMALANAVGPEDLALLIFGVEDEKRGRGVLPIEHSPEPESIVQILASYIHPPARIAPRDYELDEGLISVVAVFHSPARPHYALRAHPEILSLRDVYVRRDCQVGVLTPPELERLIREKDAVVGPIAHGEPIQFGFVGRDANNPRVLTFRLQNVITEPVTGISLIVDASLMGDPSARGRLSFLGNATLGPGESRDVEIELANFSIYKTLYVGNPLRIEHFEHRRAGRVTDNWLDLNAHVSYRGADGLVRQHDCRLSLDA